LEVNFGDDMAKPFAYDIKKCPRRKIDEIIHKVTTQQILNKLENFLLLG
jgi:hypothetical protein